MVISDNRNIVRGNNQQQCGENGDKNISTGPALVVILTECWEMTVENSLGQAFECPE